ncbi:helix-turn-helix domain-containing protein [Blautia producta]|uniref:helix-turn-helix domain-containing protein n=1 Tax=Blautia producta TaxID=33035 RepID=UPI0031B5E4FE
MKKMYFYKILILYSLITLVLTVGFFLIYYRELQSEYIETFREQNDAFFSGYVEESEERVATLIDMASYIKLAETLGPFASSGNADYYPSLTALFQELSSIRSGNRSWQCDYIVHKLKDKTCVTNTSTSSLPLALERVELSEDQYGQVLARFSVKDIDNASFIITDHRLIFTSTKSFGTNQVVITVAIKLQDAGYEEYGESSFADFFVSDTDIMDFRTEKGLQGERTIDSIQELKQPDESIVEKDGWNYRFEESELANITYFLVDFMPGMDRMAGADLGRITLVLLMMFFLAFVAIIFVSKQLYKPIGRLVETFAGQGGTAGQASVTKDEMEYVYQQVSDIRNKNQDLVNTMKEIEENSKKRLSYGILMGDFREDTLKQEIVNFGLEWLDSKNYIVSFELREEAIPEAAGEMTTLYNKINDILQQELEKEYKVLPVTEIAKNYYFIVCCGKEDLLCSTLNRILALLDTAFSIPIIFYVSKASDRAMTLSYSFLTLTQIWETKNSLPFKSVYTFGDVSDRLRHLDIYPLSVEEKFLTAVENANKEEMKKLLDYIFAEYVEYGYDNKQIRTSLIYALVNTIRRAVQRSGISIDSVLTDKDQFLQGLKLSTTPEELKKNILQVLEHILELEADLGVYKAGDLRERIEIFVHEHITQDISLISMSDYFQLSPNYMSAIFKTTMGENFKDYISRSRFRFATEVLKARPSITLTELADTCGINSVTTLTRLFKKYAGCSPGQYLKKSL